MAPLVPIHSLFLFFFFFFWRSAVPATSHLDRHPWGGWEGREPDGSGDQVETHRITNLRGRRDSTGNKAKQMTKQARAPRLQAPKMSKRSQRLTRKQYYVSIALFTNKATPPCKLACSHGQPRHGNQARGYASCRGAGAGAAALGGGYMKAG